MKKLDNLSNSESEDEYQVVGVQEKTRKGMTVNIKIKAVPIQFQIDSGADVNIIDESSFRRLSGSVILKKTRAKLFPYNATAPLPLLGKFTAEIATKKRFDVAKFYVVKGSSSSGCLLGPTSAMNLGILYIVNNVKLPGAGSKVTPKMVVPKPAALTGKLSELIAANDNIFHGTGKMKGVKVKLHIDEKVKPVAQKQQRVPFYLRES